MSKNNNIRSSTAVFAMIALGVIVAGAGFYLQGFVGIGNYALGVIGIIAVVVSWIELGFNNLFSPQRLRDTGKQVHWGISWVVFFNSVLLLPMFGLSVPVFAGFSGGLLVANGVFIFIEAFKK